MRWAAIFISICLAACGQIVEQKKKNKSQNNAETTANLSLSPSEKIYVAAAFFTDPVGSIATVGIAGPHPVEKSLVVTDSSDVVVRSFGGQLFVINRGNTSTIQVIDPDSLDIVGNYSVEAGSNPHDLVVANGKAFISRYDANLADNKDDLWVVNPVSGARLTSIDLKPYTTDDGERLARASLMALVGNSLYVLMQDLSLAFTATTTGKVAVINTVTNAVEKVIELAGRNPTSIAYHEGSDRLFITDTGVYQAGFTVDLSTAYGGLEAIDAAANETLGIVIDDQTFGGYLFGIVFAGGSLGVVTLDAERVATFNPNTLAVVSTSLYTTPSGFIPELLADGNGRIWIPERNPRNDGMIVMDPTNGAILDGPLAVGALPASMSLIR